MRTIAAATDPLNQSPWLRTALFLPMLGGMRQHPLRR
ncbi:protein of unknown function [Paraburkholderia dioscoreae]|uniref:Uncharacterized protein n=1 Tax=Paraburkholderia dioscoreae TaxID=2604047 RepID=A0A5Q4ZHP6_9BURK|nr:protein of unknown function [Paraburkholderia dioscoreae]